MKQIVLVSGKGGTGKSTIAACLAQLVPDKMLADCDVDTPNLHLLLHHIERSREDYSGASVAEIDPDRCIACGRCLEACRFDAITPDFVVRSWPARDAPPAPWSVRQKRSAFIKSRPVR
jgi:MinD superfamily P-loop ATPase